MVIEVHPGREQGPLRCLGSDTTLGPLVPAHPQGPKGHHQGPATGLAGVSPWGLHANPLPYHGRSLRLGSLILSHIPRLEGSVEGQL